MQPSQGCIWEEVGVTAENFTVRTHHQHCVVLQETLKSVIAQYNASQLITMREVWRPLACIYASVAFEAPTALRPSVVFDKSLSDRAFVIGA